MNTSLLIRYSAVGALVTVVYLLLLHGLKGPVGSLAVASAIAFVIAVLVQYVCQARFTFGAPLKRPRQGARFAMTVLIGFALATAIVGWIGPGLGLSDLWSSIVVAALLPFLNLLMFTLWVFVSPKPLGQTPVPSATG